MFARSEPFLSKQGCGKSILGRPSGMKSFCHRPEHFPQACGLCRGEPDGVNHFFDGKVDQFTNSGRRAENAGSSSDMPSRVVMSRINGVADPRFRFESKDEGEHEIASAHAVCACVRKKGRS